MPKENEDKNDLDTVPVEEKKEKEKRPDRRERPSRWRHDVGVREMHGRGVDPNDPKRFD